jgi:CRISPR-associated protein Cas6
MDDLAPSKLVDLAFALQGRSLPRHHRQALAQAVLQRLPWLADEPQAGLHRLNLPAGGTEALLSNRSRLVLRLPRKRVEQAQALAGAELPLGPHRLRVQGPGQVRELLPYGTLYAHLVAAEREAELDFLADVDQALQRLGIAGRRMCGRQQLMTEAQAEAQPTLVGYSLMLDGLQPAHAQQLMEHGLGPYRLWGCGLFVPHKSAAAVGS